MSESDSGEKTLDASLHKLRQAREEGNVAVSREGAVAGIYLAALLEVALVSGEAIHHVGDLLLPLLDQPEAFLDGTALGLTEAARAVAVMIGLVLAPLFALLIAGVFVPYLLQNALVISTERLVPKLSHLSPKAGFKRMFGQQALFEFGKNLVKMIAIALVCWYVAKPLYKQSIGLIATDVSVMPGMMKTAVVAILMAATMVAMVIAGIDVPYQHWSYRRRLRMSVQDMRDEVRSSEGDPHIKQRRQRLRRSRLRHRMLLEVPAATVVVTNPTHYAIALRYIRGSDPAPVVVAKGADLIARKIREIAFENHVAIIENPPLARALYQSVEIGETIPREHFETAAKIISLVWSRSGRPAPAGAR